MSGTDYWLRQQVSLAQWRDFHKQAERERQVELALNGQGQRTRISQLRNRVGKILLNIASRLIIDAPQRKPGSERGLQLDSCPSR